MEEELAENFGVVFERYCCIQGKRKVLEMEGAGMVIDSNIFIEHLRAKDKSKTTLRKIPIEQPLFISSVTLYELLMGSTTAEKWNDAEKAVIGLPILPFDDLIAKKAAKIFLDLKKSNNVIEFRDIFIAATVMVHNLTLLTKNSSDFSRIKTLTIIRPEELNF